MFGIYMHFLLVLACDAHCLAYFPYAYRGLYFVLVIVYFYVFALQFDENCLANPYLFSK
jgi:hypothetical protein